MKWFVLALGAALLALGVLALFPFFDGINPPLSSVGGGRLLLTPVLAAFGMLVGCALVVVGIETARP